MSSETPKVILRGVGNYDLLEKIAEGGMGTVYKGRNRGTGEPVAVKILAPHLARNRVLVRRFEQEFRAASRLNHPHIVRAIDFGQEGATSFMVMEFVDGESLGQRIERLGRIEEREAIRIIGQAAQALHKAHKHGMIHRDVKPDNILITAEGDAKLADLGLVKEVEGELNLTRTGRGLGTPHFMAPEQFRNAKNANVRCDVYSLAATLYMAVTGELPFRHCTPLDAWMKKSHDEFAPPRELAPELSERADWAIRRAMSADPNQRPRSCREFVEDLTGRSTRKVPMMGADNTGGTEWWYLYYTDEEGQTHTSKGTASAIRRSLKEGLLGEAENVRAGRDKTGPFEPIRSYAEFRDIVITAEKAEAQEQSPDPDGSADATEPHQPIVESDSFPKLPTIDIVPIRRKETTSWLTWLLLIVLAFTTAIVAYYLGNR